MTVAPQCGHCVQKPYDLRPESSADVAARLRHTQPRDCGPNLGPCPSRWSLPRLQSAFASLPQRLGKHHPLELLVCVPLLNKAQPKTLQGVRNPPHCPAVRLSPALLALRQDGLSTQHHHRHTLPVWSRLARPPFVSGCCLCRHMPLPEDQPPIRLSRIRWCLHPVRMRSSPRGLHTRIARGAAHESNFLRSPREPQTPPAPMLVDACVGSRRLHSG